MWPQKEHSKCRVLLAEQTTWSDVLWFVTLCVFKLELQGFYPCCDVWIGSWIYLCCTFCFVFVLYSILWCWVHRLLGSMAWCSSIFSCVCVKIQHLNLLEVGGQTFTLSPHFCFSVINYIWIIVSECCRQPDQIRLFFAEKKNKNITVKSRERTRRSEKEIDKEIDREWKRGQNGSKVVELDELYCDWTVLLYIKVNMNQNMLLLCFQKTWNTHMDKFFMVFIFVVVFGYDKRVSK